MTIYLGISARRPYAGTGYPMLTRRCDTGRDPRWDKPEGCRLSNE